MAENYFNFVIVVSNKVTHSIECSAENYVTMATGMMLVERKYHKTASMYVYRKSGSEYRLIKKMDAREGTIMPESFDFGVKPQTLNEIAKMHENNIY